MNHQPYRGWLLSEDELTVEQAQALQEHLRSCETCSQIESSWKQLEAVISRAIQFEPAPGFVARWQVRLVERQRYQQKQRGWYIIGATALIVVSLGIILSVQLWSLIQAPGPYLAALFDRLVGVISIYFTLRNFTSFYSLPGPVYTFIGIVFLSGLISFMSVLWLATYRKFSMTRRTV